MNAITYAMCKKYTDKKVDQSAGLHREIVNSLPSTGDNNTIYMVLDPNASSPDVYDEWLWVNGVYEHIGSTRVELTDYYNKTQVDTALNGKANVATSLSGYGITDAYTKTEVDTALGNRLEIQNNAGFHNSVYRGKSLGSSVTAAQQQAIHNGTFEDLFIGDYWTINDVNYRIAEFDYWLHGGDEECRSHHVVLVPDSILYTARMNSTDTTEGGYTGSEMRGGTGVSAGNLAQARTIITNAFGASSLLVHKEYLSSAVTDGYVAMTTWCNSDIELMNEQMVYGALLLKSATNGGTMNKVANYELSKTQLALFRYSASAMCTRSSWWLRDVVTTKQFVKINTYGNASSVSASSSSTGVRPCFAITY